MTTITISRQFGSYGDEIARRVCEILECRYFDKKLIADAAKASGLSEQEIVDYSEENYKVRTFLDNLAGRPRHVAQIHVWKEDLKGANIYQNVNLDEETALMMVQNAILHAHHLGNVVIVGRGGQALLKDKTAILHVRIKAPYEERILRTRAMLLQENHGDDTRVDQRRKAQDLIQEKDGASESYVRNYYGIDWDDPSLYHICLNTGKLNVEQAAQIIAKAAAEIPEHQKDREFAAA